MSEINVVYWIRFDGHTVTLGRNDDAVTKVLLKVQIPDWPLLNEYSAPWRNPAYGARLAHCLLWDFFQADTLGEDAVEAANSYAARFAAQVLNLFDGRSLAITQLSVGAWLDAEQQKEWDECRRLLEARSRYLPSNN